MNGKYHLRVIINYLLPQQTDTLLPFLALLSYLAPRTTELCLLDFPVPVVRVVVLTGSDCDVPTAFRAAIATIENIQYTILEGFGDGDFGALKLVLMRGVMSVPLHCITGILIGGGVAFAAFDPKTRYEDRVLYARCQWVFSPLALTPLSFASVYKRLPFILFWPIVLHGCFDAVEFLALQESQTRDNTLALVSVSRPMLFICSHNFTTLVVWNCCLPAPAGD